MKNAVAMQRGIAQRDRTPLITKLILLCVFILGIAIIAMGYAGMQAYSASGFSSETAYWAIHALSGDVDSAWNKKLEPQLSALTADERAAVGDAARALLTDAWESQKKGGAEEARALLTGAEEGNRPALTHKLLYTTYLLSGPKVGAGIKKEVAALAADRLPAFRQELLLCAADESAPVPPEGAKALEGLSGRERQAMALQMWFLSNDSAAATDPAANGSSPAKSRATPVRPTEYE